MSKGIALFKLSFDLGTTFTPLSFVPDRLICCPEGTRVPSPSIPVVGPGLGHYGYWSPGAWGHFTHFHTCSWDQLLEVWKVFVVTLVLWSQLLPPHRNCWTLSQLFSAMEYDVRNWSMSKDCDTWLWSQDIQAKKKKATYKPFLDWICIFSATHSPPNHLPLAPIL